MVKKELRDKLISVLKAGEPLPQYLIDQWNKLTGSYIGKQ